MLIVDILALSKRSVYSHTNNDSLDLGRALITALGLLSLSGNEGSLAELGDLRVVDWAAAFPIAASMSYPYA